MSVHRNFFMLGAYLFLSFSFATCGREEPKVSSRVSKHIIKSFKAFGESEEAQFTLMPCGKKDYALLGWAISGSSSLIKKFDLKKNHRTIHSFNEPVSFVIPHDTDNIVLVGFKSGKIEIYDKQFQSKNTTLSKNDYSLQSVIFRPGKNEIVVCSRNKKNGKCKVEVLSCSGTILWTFDYLDDKIPQISFDESGHYFCLYDDCSFFVYQFKNEELKCLREHSFVSIKEITKEVKCSRSNVVVLRLGNVLQSVGDPGVFHFDEDLEISFSLSVHKMGSNKKAVRSFDNRCSLFNGVPVISLSDNGKVLAYVLDKDVFLYDVDQDKNQKHCSHKKHIRFVKLNKDGSRLLVGTDRRITLYNVETKEMIARERLSGITSALFLPKNDGLFAVTENNKWFTFMDKEKLDISSSEHSTIPSLYNGVLWSNRS